jgi:hypothetical protein
MDETILMQEVYTGHCLYKEVKCFIFSQLALLTATPYYVKKIALLDIL